MITPKMERKVNFDNLIFILLEYDTIFTDLPILYPINNNNKHKITYGKIRIGFPTLNDIPENKWTKNKNEYEIISQNGIFNIEIDDCFLILK